MLGDNEVAASPVIVVVAGKTGIVDDHSPQAAALGESNSGIEIAAAAKILGGESNAVDAGPGSGETINEAGIVTAITEAFVLDDAVKGELFGVSCLDVSDGVIANAIFGLNKIVIAGNAENGEFVTVNLAGGTVDEFADGAGGGFAFGGFDEFRKDGRTSGQGRKAEELAAS